MRGKETFNRTETVSGDTVNRLVFMLTVFAWVVLGIGTLLCLKNVNDFNDANLELMIGIGFLVASVQIYVIGVAIKLFSDEVENNKAE